MSFSKTELLWWRENPLFDDKNWWLKEIRTADGHELRLDEDHEELVLRVEGTGGVMAFSPGPIFWECLRRHPAIEKIAMQFLGRHLKPVPSDPSQYCYTEAEYGEILRRLRDQIELSEDWQRCVFQLLAGYQLPWIRIPSYHRLRFVETLNPLLEFLRPHSSNALVQDAAKIFYQSATSKNDHATETNNLECDLESDRIDSRDAPGGVEKSGLGDLFLPSNFIKFVNIDSKSGVMTIAEPDERKPSTKRVLMLDDLEDQLSKIGREIIVSAVKGGLDAASITRSLESKLRELNSSVEGHSDKIVPYRVHPSILQHISNASEKGVKGENARKQFNRWFDRFNLSIAFEAL